MIRAARWITPRVVMDSYIPVVAFVLVLWIWLAIVFWVLPDMCSSGQLRLLHADRAQEGGLVSFREGGLSRDFVAVPRHAEVVAHMGRDLRVELFSLRYSARTFSGSPSLNQAAASW